MTKPGKMHCYMDFNNRRTARHARKPRALWLLGHSDVTDCTIFTSSSSECSKEACCQAHVEAGVVLPSPLIVNVLHEPDISQTHDMMSATAISVISSFFMDGITSFNCL